MLNQNPHGTNILSLRAIPNDIHKFWIMKKDNSKCEVAPLRTMKAHRGVEI